MHNAAFRRYGLAEVAATPAELRVALGSALAGGRTRHDFSTLPSAASFILARADRARLADAA
jgi:hypothetical protein